MNFAAFLRIRFFLQNTSGGSVCQLLQNTGKHKHKLEHGHEMCNRYFAVYCALTVCKVQLAYPVTPKILKVFPTRRNSMPNFFNTKNVMRTSKRLFYYSLKNFRLVGKDQALLRTVIILVDISVISVDLRLLISNDPCGLQEFDFC